MARSLSNQTLWRNSLYNDLEEISVSVCTFANDIKWCKSYFYILEGLSLENEKIESCEEKNVH